MGNLNTYAKGQMVIEIIYLDQSDRLSKRRVKVLKVSPDRMLGYCFSRQALRTFKINHILAIQPLAAEQVMVP